ncbi:MAG TPA: hypothetical protein EYF95_04195 [Flavobacteriales bacterium]|nr:hypothetical protein [Flavobacteriales bacterium]
MRIDLTFDDLEEILAALQMSAHDANKTAHSGEYPSAVTLEMAGKVADIYSLMDKITNQRRRLERKPTGSSGIIDPFDTPTGKDEANTVNDPIEW